MQEKTKELLAACKKAGYEHVAIFCSNENVPESVETEKNCLGYWTGGPPNHPSQPQLVCASPPQRGLSTRQSGGNWPKIWDIIKDLKLNFAGAGYGDCFPVEPALFKELDMGYYSLTSGNPDFGLLM